MEESAVCLGDSCWTRRGWELIRIHVASKIPLKHNHTDASSHLFWFLSAHSPVWRDYALGGKFLSCATVASSMLYRFVPYVYFSTPTRDESSLSGVGNQRNNSSRNADRWFDAVESYEVEDTHLQVRENEAQTVEKASGFGALLLLHRPAHQILLRRRELFGVCDRRKGHKQSTGESWWDERMLQHASCPPFARSMRIGGSAGQHDIMSVHLQDLERKKKSRSDQRRRHQRRWKNNRSVVQQCYFSSYMRYMMHGNELLV